MRAQQDESICTLSVLGSFSLRRRESAVAPLPKKAQALLAYLALHRDKPVPREKLASFFWEDAGHEQARRSLRQCLTTLKAALGPGDKALIVGPGGIKLHSGAIDVDALRFESLAGSSEASDLELAGALYRDELLSGLQIASEAFSDWLKVERRRLDSRCSDVLYRLAAARWKERELDKALAAAERLSRFDALREDGHRLHMQLLAAAGHRNAALKQHQTFSEALRSELGVAPDPETSRLADEIRRGERPGQSTSEPPPTPMHPVDKPSLAVLPLVNLSGAPEQDYFADGIAEDLTTALGRFPWLFVIASGSAFTYRGHNADVRRIGAELGVRYVLRGSLRKDSKRLRITVQLADAAGGHYLWSERLDGEVDEVFAMQDRVAAEVAALIAPAVHFAEIDRARRKTTENLSAYDLYLRAVPRFRSTLAENQEALRLLYQAIALDRSYGAAYALAARCYQFQKIFGWVGPADPRLQEGIRLGRLGAEHGRNDSEALWMAGLALVQLAGELDYGRALIERSLFINPNSAYAWTAMCFVHAYFGEVQGAIAAFGRAQALNPRDSTHHINWQAAAIAYFIAGRYEDSEKAADLTLAQSPTYPPAMRVKVVTSALLGRRAEALAWKERLLRLNPDWTVAWMRAYFQPFWSKKPEALENFLEGMRRAGVPEGAARVTVK